MTQEDKNLLLKDLCARLPYGVKCKDWTYDENDREIDTIEELEVIFPKSMKYRYSGIHAEHSIERIKPYLRPMSSMTEEEEVDFTLLCEEILSVGKNGDVCVLNVGQIDWLNEHYFDYRGLIEKGFAIAVTEENNPYK